MIAGAGRLVAGVVIEKVAAFDVVVAFETVIAAVPGNAVSAAVIAAVSCVALTKVVGRGEPFQFATSPFTKFVPLTVSVKPAGLQNGVDGSDVVDAESEVMAGATTENESALEVPPAGAGLNTVTEIVAAEAMSVASMEA